MAVFDRLKVEIEHDFARQTGIFGRRTNEQSDVTHHENTTYWSDHNMVVGVRKNLADFVVSAALRGDLEPSFR